MSLDPHNEILFKAISTEVFKLAVQNALNHIIVTDIDGKIIYANSAVERITGYSLEEIIGNTPTLWGKQMSEEFYKDLWKTIKSEGKVFSGELTNKKKDGTLYQAKAVISPVKDRRGMIMGFIGTEEIVQDSTNTNDLPSIPAVQLEAPLQILKSYVDDLDMNNNDREILLNIKSAVDNLIALVNKTAEKS